MDQGGDWSFTRKNIVVCNETSQSTKKVAGKLSYRMERKTLNIQLGDDNSIKELLKLFDEAFKSPATPDRVAILIDARSSRVNWSDRDIRRIVAELNKWAERIVCGAVVVSTDLPFGATRQLAAYAENRGWNWEPFREIESAKEWLTEKLEQHVSL